MRSQIKGRFHPATELEIENYLCSDLTPAAAARFELQLTRDAALAAYVAQRRTSQREFAQRHPWNRAWLETAAAAPLPRRRAAPWFGAVLGAAAGLLLLVTARFALPPAPQTAGASPHAPPAANAVRVKGTGLHTELYVKRGGQVFLHRHATRLRAGDELRLAVDCAQAGYLTVLGRDARGRIAAYYDAVRTTPGRFVLPDSLRLDAAAGGEDWLILHAEAARPWQQYAEAWRAGREPRSVHALIHLEREGP